MSLGCMILAYVAGKGGSEDKSSSSSSSHNKLSESLLDSAHKMHETLQPSEDEVRNSISDSNAKFASMELDDPQHHQDGQDQSLNLKGNFILGVIFTVAVGILGGSVFVPLELAPAEIKDGFNALRFAFAQGVCTVRYFCHRFRVMTCFAPFPSPQ